MRYSFERLGLWQILLSLSIYIQVIWICITSIILLIDIESQMESEASKTLEVVEFGNLDLDFPIEQGILLLGQTKAGKTTAAHHLVRQLLDGINNESGNIVYTVHAGQLQYQNALIGHKEHNSQTQIPNIFRYNLNNKIIHLVDCPGYLDTYGCSRVISNGYFHFKVFKQVKEVSFILTIQFNDMNGVAANFRSTFKSFFDSFEKFSTDQENILPALSLLITKVPPNQDLNSIIKRLTGLNPFKGGEIRAAFEAFKNEVINNNKIFLFNAAELGRRNNIENHLLRDINSRTKFWKHDLSRIKISIRDRVLRLNQDEEEFQEELTEIGGFYHKILSSKFQKLKAIMAQLLEESYQINDTNNNKYQELVKNYVTEEITPKQLPHTPYMMYEAKRNQNRIKLKQISVKGMVSASEGSQKPVWIQKINILQKAYEQVANVQGRLEYLYSVQGVEEHCNILLTIIKEIIKLNRQNLVESGLLKFAYDVFSLLETSNTFYKILRDPKVALQQPNSPLGFILTDYPMKLSDILYGLYEKSPLNNRIDLIKTIDITSPSVFSSPKQYFAIKNLLKETANQIQVKRQQGNDINSELVEMSSTNIDNVLQQISNLEVKLGLHNFSIEISQLNNGNPDYKKIKMILRELENMRSMIQAKFKINQLPNDEKTGYEQNSSSNKLKLTRAKAVNLLAEAMMKIPQKGAKNLAIDLYDFNCNAFKIFEYFEKSESQMKNDNITMHTRILFLIKYCMKASQYRRFNLAFEKLQQASHYVIESENQKFLNQMNQMSEKIIVDSVNQQNMFISFEVYSNKIFPGELAKKVNSFLENLQNQIVGK